jgi:hypothetical protein
MSPKGQKRTSAEFASMSALPLKADIPKNNRQRQLCAKSRSGRVRAALILSLSRSLSYTAEPMQHDSQSNCRLANYCAVIYQIICTGNLPSIHHSGARGRGTPRANPRSPREARHPRGEHCTDRERPDRLGARLRSEGATAANEVSATTLFQAGSISKPIAALCALILIQQGRLELDADVNARLAFWRIPQTIYTEQQPVTMRLILSHRAGVTVHGFPGYAAGAPIPSLLQVLDGRSP